MTRITSMAKFTRLTASPSVVRPTSMASGASKVSAALTHELGADGRSSDHENSRRGMTTTHGPARVMPNPNRTIPLMQSFFHSSTSRPAGLATMPSSLPIDFIVLPNMYSSAAAPEPMVRVPLLPDNFTPNRSAAMFSAEVPDAPLARPEISVIAQHPEKVISALTEVEGFGVDGLELKFVHELENGSAEEGQAMIRIF